MAHIKVKLKCNNEYSIWDKQLDGLTGDMIHVEKSCWGGYVLQVKLDNPPTWCNKERVQVFACEKVGRNVTVDFTEEELKNVHLMAVGLMTYTQNPICANCNKIQCICEK